MQVTIDINDNALDKVMYLLKNLSDVKVLQDVDKVTSKSSEDLSFLDDEIQKGLDSGKSEKTHSGLMNELKQKYA